MRALLALTIVTLVGVSTSAPMTTAVDWDAVSQKADEIESTVSAAVRSVIATAKSDNAAVGGDIERKLAGPSEQARAVLAEAKVAIGNRNLNEADAKEKFDRLKTILAGAQEAIRPDVAKLSAAAQNSIRDTLNSAYATAERLANEIYVLLRNNIALLAIDWDEVSRRVDEIESIVTAAVRSVIGTAKSDNADVGTDVERKLAGPSEEAKGVLAEARVEIGSRNLDEQKAKQTFDRLRAIVAGAQEAIRADVAKLSASAQNNIRDTFNSVFATAERLANEIYALLRQ